jgi:tRNA pseudouridine55 synthase
MAAGKYVIEDFPVIGTNNDQPADDQLFNPGAIFLMDKPKTWSSFDVVKYVRSRVPVKKVGHAGTLDPLATGLLICCCGKATKTISQFHNLKKVYSATITFGASTPSYDAATEADETADWGHIREDELRKVLLEQFTGDIMQKPPVYSALRVNGKRLYKYARKGQEVEIKERPVIVYNIHIDLFNLPEVKLTITCGKGTYIRSLAHDLGLALGSRAYLSDLRRTKTGTYSVENAFTPEEIDSYLSEGNR